MRSHFQVYLLKGLSLCFLFKFKNSSGVMKGKHLLQSDLSVGQSLIYVHVFIRISQLLQNHLTSEIQKRGRGKSTKNNLYDSEVNENQLMSSHINLVPLLELLFRCTSSKTQ